MIGGGEGRRLIIEIQTIPEIIIPKISGQEMNYLNIIEVECRANFFYFIKTILQPILPKEFGLSHGRHFKQMFNLIRGDFTGFDLFNYGQCYTATRNNYHNKKLGLVPRMHGKTRVGTEAFAIWSLYNNPDTRILIMSETWNNARRMLYVIKQYYLRIKENQRDMRTRYRIPGLIMGDWMGEPWNEDAIYVKKRQIAEKTPSIATAGLGTEVTSQHYDIIIGDDLIGKENSGTLDQIHKASDDIAALSEVGDYTINNRTLFLFWGTRWHPQDGYGFIIKELADIYDILVLKCWNERNHDPLFPEKFTSELLEQIKDEKLRGPDPMQWYLQWLNDPTPVARSPFNPDYFKYYNADTLPKDLRIYILTDLGLTEKTYSCPTAIAPVAIDNFGKHYMLPYWREKEKDPFKIAQKIIEFGKLYYRQGLICAGIEKNGNYETVKLILAQRAPWLSVLPLEPANRTKDNRILGLQPILMTGRFYIMNDMTELKEEMIEFQPFSENTNRDLLDAICYIRDLEPEPELIPVQAESNISRINKIRKDSDLTSEEKIQQIRALSEKDLAEKFHKNIGESDEEM